MKKLAMLVLVAGFLVGCSPKSASETAEQPVRQEVIKNLDTRPQIPVEPVTSKSEAIAAIKKLGGILTVDDKSAGQPVIGLDFSETFVTDGHLVYLKWLKNLQTLMLYDTQITDAGLVNLVGLTKLQVLGLSDTKVTDAGLAQLAGRNTLPNYALSCTNRPHLSSS